jgi:hypothetical protein
VAITGNEGDLFIDALPYGMRTRSSANFVGCIVGFLSVLIIRLRSLLLAAALSFEIEMV